MRLFVIGFSTKNKNQVSKNCYANMRLVRAVRYRMNKIVKNRIATQDITKAVNDLTHDVISDLLFKRCNPLLPLRDVKIRKIKMLRTPRVDREELLKNHGEVPESNEGKTVEVETAEAA
jgi:small subunit ribosomal protein S3Ae